MKKILVLLCTVTWSMAACALSGQPYMDRFNAYWAWSQQLPNEPNADFITFIQETGPLSQKLRNRWLHKLAKNQDWADYAKYYQYTHDQSLICFYQIAQYNLGKKQQVATTAIPLWLTGKSTPQACNTLFDMLITDGTLDQSLVTKRIALALEKRNLSLARNLIKHYLRPSTNALRTLNKIARNPYAIRQLSPNDELASAFYLYGLRRLISSNMKQAINYWSSPKTKTMLNEAEQQTFLSQVAIYKAMRNNEDAAEWFMKIKPQYYTKVVLNWQIRYALKQHNWAKVTKLINNLEDKDSSCWQYWLARALEEQGQKQQANEIYQKLASDRHYYGFLASRRLHAVPQFENEKPSNPNTLKAYQSFIDEVKDLYQNKQTLQASRMIHDFISELPKEEASALVHWIDKELQWYGKSVYLSSNETLNDQLILRFPLAYRDTINQYSKQYHVAPEFIYAIIRQESGFREDVTSSAGARGLMQVMPKTATAVSKKDKIPYHDHRELFSSQKNINIGVAYLKQLGKRFDAHPILIAASYNAGPKQVVYWLKTHPPKEIDLWIETLPWRETRNYLKNVFAFYVVYQYRLNQKPDLNSFLEPLGTK